MPDINYGWILIWQEEGASNYSNKNCQKEIDNFRYDHGGITVVVWKQPEITYNRNDSLLKKWTAIDNNQKKNNSYNKKEAKQYVTRTGKSR